MSDITEDRRHPSNEELIAHVDRVFDTHVQEEIERYKSMEQRIESIEKSMDELLGIIKGAKWIGGFIRWAVAVAAGGAALVLWVKEHIQFK